MLSAQAASKPLNLYGNLGYNYRLLEPVGGGKTEGSQLKGSLNASGYLWRPWFVTADGGASVSINNVDAPTTDTESNLVSGRINLNVFPESRFPFRMLYARTENVIEWIDEDQTYLVDLDHTYRARLFDVRQRITTGGGNQLDAWYNRRLRGASDEGDRIDDTVGTKLRWRGVNYNLYAQGSAQARTREQINDDAESYRGIVNFNYVPSTDFYDNTIVNYTRVENETDFSNGAFARRSETDIGQVSNHFFWRPRHKPYTVTGAARMTKQEVDFTNLATASSERLGFDANAALRYRVTPNFRVDGSSSVSSLDTESSNSVGARGNVTADYQSDRYLLRGFEYYWFGNAGVGATITAQYQDRDITPNSSAGLGHSGQRRWKTGNRSTMRLSLTQTAREQFSIGEDDAVLTLNHTGNLVWQNSPAGINQRAQLTLYDSHSVGEGVDTQLANLQVSHNQNMSRLSTFGAHLSVQSSRRLFDGAADGFSTTATGRVDYRHRRLFGIYRLRLDSKFDVSTTANRGGSDRRQFDGEVRLGYQIGKLSLSSTYRLVRNETGNGSNLLFVQVNRSF